MVKILSTDELQDLNFGDVKARVDRAVAGGRHLFRIKSAEVKPGEDKEGNPRNEIHFRSEVIKTLSLDDDSLNPDDYEGQSISNVYYGLTPENIERIKAYLNAVLGREVNEDFPTIMQALNTGQVRYIARVTTRKYQGRDISNLSNEPKHYTGHDKLEEKYLTMGDE